MARYLKSSVIRKTQKATACIWCGETIEVGKPAFLHVYVDDGDIHSDRFHPECDLACIKHYNDEQCWGETFEPYEAARGSTLCKSDYRIMQEKEKDSG